MHTTTLPGNRLAEFSELVHRIYAASANPAVWGDAVASVGRSMGGTRALLFTPLAAPQEGGFIFPWQMDDAYIALWASKYIALDVWTQGAQQRGLARTGNVITDQDMLPTAELHASVYYREFLSAHDVEHVCAGIIFEGEPGLPATITSIYRDQSAGPFGLGDKEWLTLLLPHLSRALGMMHRLNLARHQEQSLRAALDRLTVGVMLLDQQLRVMFTNAAGQRALNRHDGLSVDANGQLRAMSTQSAPVQTATDWMTQIARLPITDRGAFGETFQVKRQSTASTYTLQCCPLEQTDPIQTHEGAHFIVFVTDPDQVNLPPPAQLQKQLGLTPAESRIALSLAQGMSYRDAALNAKVTEETLRTHVKAIYSKTRVTQKASLTRLVMSLGAAVV